MLLEIQNLTKRFGGLTAVSNVSFAIERGEIIGIFGPNGSGKSTTIRVLLGLIKASGGRARLFDEDPWKNAVSLHRRLAYVPGDVNLWPNLTGGETIDMLGSLRGGLDPKRRQDLVDRFELDLTKKASAYSKGNRQKVALIAALASDAELFIFDEPTSALDPLKEAVFQECVKEITGQGHTILLSSHILGQLEHLADTFTIIRNGRTVETGTLEHLRQIAANAGHDSGSLSLEDLFLGIYAGS